MDLVGRSPNAIGIATGAVLMGLFDYLLENNMIRPHDIGIILNKAADGLAPRANISSVKEAVGIIRGDMLKRLEKSVKKD